MICIFQLPGHSHNSILCSSYICIRIMYIRSSRGCGTCSSDRKHSFRTCLRMQKSGMFQQKILLDFFQLFQHLTSQEKPIQLRMPQMPSIKKMQLGSFLSLNRTARMLCTNQHSSLRTLRKMNRRSIHREPLIRSILRMSPEVSFLLPLCLIPNLI